MSLALYVLSEAVSFVHDVKAAILLDLKKELAHKHIFLGENTPWGLELDAFLDYFWLLPTLGESVTSERRLIGW